MGTRARYPTPNQDMRHLSPISNSATNILFFYFLSTILPLVCIQAANGRGRISALGHVYSGSGTRGPKFGLGLHVCQRGMGEFSFLSDVAMALCSQQFFLKYF